MKITTMYECEYCGRRYDSRDQAQICEKKCSVTDAEALEAYETIAKYCRKHNECCEYKGNVCALYDYCRVRNIGGYNAIK